MPKRIHLPKAALKNLYLRQKLSTNKIAEKYSCHRQTILNKLKHYGIEISRGPLISKKELIHLYKKRKLPYSKIAEIFHCSSSAIYRRMKKFKIKARDAIEANIKYPKQPFDKDLIEKAYLIGFRLGDLYVAKTKKNGETIRVDCSSTKKEQIELIKKLFNKYGYCWTNKRETKRVDLVCYLDNSFNFLLPKKDEIENWILRNNAYFTSFVAGYTDAEGSFGLNKGDSQFLLDSQDRNILFQIYKKLNSLGICSPKPKYLSKKLWRLAIYRRDSLHKFAALIRPYLNHQKRTRDLERTTRLGAKND